MQLSVFQKWVDLRTILLAGIIFLVTYWLFNRLTTKRRNLPPGPRGLPLLGNVFSMANATPFCNFRDMAAKYGDVFMLRIGSQLFVVLNSYDTIRKALVDRADDFVDRPPITSKIGTKDDGVIVSNGALWKFKRRMILSNLRNFGMGKALMEKRILDESEYLLKEFENHQGNLFDPTEHTNIITYNVMCSMTLGERFDYNDPRLKTCVSILESHFEMGRIYLALGTMFRGAGAMLDFITWKKNFRNHDVLYRIVEPFLKQHDETYNPDHTRDFIDVFLKITKDRAKENSDFPLGSQDAQGLSYHYYYEHALILDMFAAGTETTSTTLMWGWLFMMKYPDIQKKVQEELDRVVGKDRQPNMSDRVNLPYTEATITEVLRLASTLPLSVPRWTVSDTQIHGYDIPKDTMVLPNIWSVLRDPELWKNPERLDPSHFLDSEGKFSRPDIYIPFGLGPRVCLGEQLAKMELFLIFSRVLQNYDIRPDDAVPLPEMMGRMHITLQPPKYKMRAIKR
ncbi:cytochrome P450 2J6-like [Glandiceps talaboti]